MEERKGSSLLEQTVIQQGLKIEKLENLYHGIVLTSREDKFELQEMITQAVQDGLKPYLTELGRLQEKVSELELKEYTRELQEKSQHGMKGIVRELLFPILRAIVFAIAAYTILKIYGIQI